MRLAIVADIHGNARALAAVLADCTQCGVDRVLSLGDNIGYGPEPEEVVQHLRRHQVASVMGNHELALVNRDYLYRLHAVAKDSLRRTRALLSPESLAWLEALPPVLVEENFRLVHGCPPQSMTIYLHNLTTTRLQRLFGAYPEQFCFAGHTHDLGCYAQIENRILSRKPQVEDLALEPGGRYLLLPGSVGQPRDSLNWHAKYMIWDQSAHTITVRAVAYDVQTTIRLLGERGFPVSNAKRLFW